jgi:hypothetical protein
MYLPDLSKYDKLYNSANGFIKRILEQFFTDTVIKIVESKLELSTYSGYIFCQEAGKEDQEIKFLVLLNDPDERRSQWHRKEAHFFIGEEPKRHFFSSPQDGSIYEETEETKKAAKEFLKEINNKN